MQYADHATDLDCEDEICKICGTAKDTNYPINDITRRFNAALDRFYTLAFEADGRWNWDDFNEAAPPIGSQNLVSGTNRYAIDTFDVDGTTIVTLDILRVEILTSAGKGRFLTPEMFNNLCVDNAGAQSGRISGTAEDTFKALYVDASSGTPTHYCKFGDYIYLRPKPNYSETDGLVAYVNRPAAYMATTDTTKVPGAPVIFHMYLCRLAALPYLIENNMPSANSIMQLIQIDEQAIKQHFARRDKDIPPGLIVRQEDCR